MRHVQRAVEQIAERIRQVGIVALDESLLAEIRVVAGGDVAHQIIAQRFGAVFVGEHIGIDDVADALAHLRAADVPPAVDEQLRHFFVGKAQRLQHDRPVDAVRGNEDVFADDVQRRPPRSQKFCWLSVER